MYSDEVKKDNTIEVDIHPISKWRRILLFLGDFFIHFIVGVLVMNLIVMPITSLIVKPETAKSYEAEKKRDDILYEHKLLFYKSEENSDGKYKKYDFDSNLVYSFNRYLAYYVFPDETSLNPDYPEYCHKAENEVIWTYYNNIRSDSVTYYELFKGHAQGYNLFNIEGNTFTLKDNVKTELRVYYIPGETLGNEGQKYYSSLNDMFSALFGCVIQDIYKNDLKDSAGNSFNENQAVITKVAMNYYTTLGICCIISYLISWALIYILVPMIGRSRQTPTQAIMKIDRLGFKHLLPLNRLETIITSSYSLVFNLPFIMFLPFSYTTFIYSLKIPVLPILSVISLVLLIAGLIVILFNSFDRSLVDILSQSVLVNSEEVDGIIKAKETIKELELAKKKGESR